MFLFSLAWHQLQVSSLGPIKSREVNGAKVGQGRKQKGGEEKLFLVLFGVLKRGRIGKIRVLERAVVEGGEREVGISKGGLIGFFSFLLVADNSQRKVFFLVLLFRFWEKRELLGSFSWQSLF